MRTSIAILVAHLAWTAAALAKPFETQVQIEARTGARVWNGAETSDYKIVAYLTGDLTVWVMYMEGLSGGEVYFRTGTMPDMEVASFLEANKGQSSWQSEKVESTDKQSSLKVWNRKDGKLGAMLLSDGRNSYFMIGTKKAQRLMGDMSKLQERLWPRDRIQ